MKQSRVASAVLLAGCLLVLTSGSEAWFLATDEDLATVETPVAETSIADLPNTDNTIDGTTASDVKTPDTTLPPVTEASTTSATRRTAARPVSRGKVQEASPEHKRLVEEYLLRLASQTTPEPELAHVTRHYWSPRHLPSWLPAEVRLQFEHDNNENRQRAGLPKTTPTTEAPAHVTRDYWEHFPSWLQSRVRNEIQRDNEEFLGRVANIQRQLETTTVPPAEHVTRMYWEVLPAWLHPEVRRQFQLENQMLTARRLSVDRDLTATTEAPAYEHVTRNYWEILPAWLPKRVQDELAADNLKFMRQVAGIPEPSSPMPSPASPSSRIAPLPTSQRSGGRPLRPAAAARRIEFGAAPRQAPTLPPTQPVMTQPPPPTRQPLMVESADLLPQKCKRQLDWRNQQKCSSSRSKWTFDMVEMRCKWFAHYGCQLNNGNLFNSLADCQNYCVRRILNPCEAVRCEDRYSLYQSECFLLNDTECNNRFLQKYSFISSPEGRAAMAKEEIELFCQPSAARCRNTGTRESLPTFESPPTYINPAQLPPHCELPQDRGFCRGSQRGVLNRVYFYSKRQNQCKFMVNFGCSRNQNYFANLADCYNSCGL